MDNSRGGSCLLLVSIVLHGQISPLVTSRACSQEEELQLLQAAQHAEHFGAIFGAKDFAASKARESLEESSKA